MSTIYLQGIAGYSSDLKVYQEREKQLIDAGFVCLRSSPNEQGQYWEVWMLISPIFAKGSIKGASEKAIVAWCRKLGIGHIKYGGTSMGLSPG